MNSSSIVLEAGKPQHFPEAAPLIYASVHELMDFMLSKQSIAEKVIGSLYQKKHGHFSHAFATSAIIEGQIVGIEIGYDKEQLAKQELPGSILLLLNSPVSLWQHIIFISNGIVTGYVPKPGADAYYINNMAVSPHHRRKGIGRGLLQHAIESATQKKYKRVELDVTSVNINAIRLYEKLGFIKVSESGSTELHKTHGLPPLVRMIFTI